MNVHVKISSTLRPYVEAYNPETGIDLAVPDSTTLADLAHKLAIPVTEIKFVMLNGRCAPMETLLHDGDRAAFFPAVGGG